MPRALNDKILSEISLSFRDNEAIGSPELLPVLLPVVDEARFRRVFFTAREGSLTATGAAGAFQVQLATPDDEMWKVIWCSVVNGGVTDAIFTGQVTLNIASNNIFRPISRAIAAGTTRTIVGAGSPLFPSTAPGQFIPSEVLIPRNSIFTVTWNPSPSPFQAGDVFAIEFFVEVLPKDRAWGQKKFGVVQVP